MNGNIVWFSSDEIIGFFAFYSNFNDFWNDGYVVAWDVEDVDAASTKCDMFGGGRERGVGCANRECVTGVIATFPGFDGSRDDDDIGFLAGEAIFSCCVTVSDARANPSGIVDLASTMYCFIWGRNTLL